MDLKKITKQKERRRVFLGILLAVASGALILFSFFMLENYFLSFLAVVFMIVGIAISKTASDEGYHESTGVYRFSVTNGKRFDEMYEAFKDYETPLGKPWIGRAAIDVKKSMIYGPTEKESFIYIFYRGKTCYVSGIGMASVSNSKNQGNDKKGFEKAASKIGAAYSFSDSELVDSFAQMVRNYIENDEVIWKN